MPDTDSDKPTKHMWDTASATLTAHLILNEPWLLGLDSRYQSLVETGTVPSKDKIIVSTPRQARELLTRSAPVYSWNDPAPIALPSLAQLRILEELPVWALGTGGVAAHLSGLAAANAVATAAAAATLVGDPVAAPAGPVLSDADRAFMVEHKDSIKLNPSFIDVLDVSLATDIVSAFGTRASVSSGLASVAAQACCCCASCTSLLAPFPRMWGKSSSWTCST